MARHRWTAGNGSTEAVLETSVLIYEDVPVVSFDVEYVSGLSSGVSVGDKNSTLSSFPSFVVERGSVERGWMTWSGNSKYPKTLCGVKILAFFLRQICRYVKACINM